MARARTARVGSTAPGARAGATARVARAGAAARATVGAQAITARAVQTVMARLGLRWLDLGRLGLSVPTLAGSISALAPCAVHVQCRMPFLPDERSRCPLDRG